MYVTMKEKKSSEIYLKQNQKLRNSFITIPQLVNLMVLKDTYLNSSTRRLQTSMQKTGPSALLDKVEVVDLFQRILQYTTSIYSRIHVLMTEFIGLWFMVFNATFNNISVISWRSVLLVEETGYPRRKPPFYRKFLTNLIT